MRNKRFNIDREKRAVKIEWPSNISALRWSVVLKLDTLVPLRSTEAAELLKYTSGQIQDGERRPNCTYRY